MRTHPPIVWAGILLLSLASCYWLLTSQWVPLTITAAGGLGGYILGARNARLRTGTAQPPAHAPNDPPRTT